MVVVVAACGLSIAAGEPPSFAATGICAQQPRDAVAQLCADSNTDMLGAFYTLVYPTVRYGAGSFPGAEAFNSTTFYFGSTLTQNLDFGLHVTYNGTTTSYSPYWVDETSSFVLHPIGPATTAPDGRNHSFMILPHCGGCNTWDVFYDFNIVGTSRAAPTNRSRDMVTGWDLSGEFGKVSFANTQNHVQWLDPANLFEQFDTTWVSTRHPDGDCRAGADPEFCFKFTTNISTVTDATVTRVSSWDVAKSIVKPGQSAAARQDTAAPAPAPVLRTLNGVDQMLLDRCLNADPAGCLATVPGLAACIHSRLICNQRGAAQTARPASSAVVAMDRDDALAAAHAFAASHGGAATQSEMVAWPSRYGTVAPNVYLSPDDAARPVWVVHGNGAVRELTGDHGVRHGYTLAFDQSSRELVYACLGQACPTPHPVSVSSPDSP